MSPTLLDERIECEAAIWVASGAQRNFRRYSILTLDGLALRGSYIGRIIHKKISRHSLLDCDDCPGWSLAAAAGQYRTYRKLRDTGDLGNTTGNLAGDL